MGVRAPDDADAAVEVPAHGALFARGFGVHVDDDDARFVADFAERALDGAERVFGRLHEGAADEIDDGERAAVARGEHADAAAGRLGIVERAQRRAGATRGRAANSRCFQV